jgi:hypothetical protein
MVVRQHNHIEVGQPDPPILEALSQYLFGLSACRPAIDQRG